MKKNEIICNICGAPRQVAFTELDEETGKRVERKHTIKCIGHNVMPWLWNKSKDYQRWQRFFESQRKRSGVENE